MSIETNVESISQHLKEVALEATKELYGEHVNEKMVNISETRKDQDGDYTLIVFPFVKAAKKKPEDVGEEIGKSVLTKSPFVSSFNTVKGFLNLSIDDSFWLNKFVEISKADQHGQQPPKEDVVLVEFASPNTNKPLHLGHIRNILLGWSASKILGAAGYRVKKVQIVNDRGIAICRSMLAWTMWGNGDTPESTATKGDHFVGQYYVKFAKEFSKEYAEWQKSDEAKTVFLEKKKDEQTEEVFFKDYKNQYFNLHSKLGADAKDLLLKWEANDPEVRSLWKKMNDWVLAGMDITYQNLKVDFDKLYFESDTYLLGKEIIQKGISEGVLQQDGKRVFVNLESIGFGNKTILKTDGTSTYTSQDLGTAQERYKDFGAKKMLYVVADEQNAHFQALFEIVKRLGEPYADGLHHLSYGMVDLPTGKMKSREGTVVDADDLISETIGEARKNALERGEMEDFSAEEKEALFEKIGLAALKYFILKVNPQKRMVFDPAGSVDMQGHTGPYIQNAYVRIQSVLKKAASENIPSVYQYEKLLGPEKELIVLLNNYPNLIVSSADQYDPSIIAAFAYDLAKAYHKFYHDCPILRADTQDMIAFRIALSKTVGDSLKNAMYLLGIDMPIRM